MTALSLVILCRDYPAETANRIMVRHGSASLLSALRGEPAPADPSPYRRAPRPIRVKPEAPAKPPYVPIDRRGGIVAPRVVHSIMQAVANAFCITLDDLIGKSRSTHFIHARAVACKIIRDRVRKDGTPAYSSTQIGAFFGRDHSTVLNAIDKFDIYCRTRPEVAEAYAALKGLAE